MGAGFTIRDYLGDHDIKHKVLANAIQLSPSTLSGYLTEARDIPEDILIQIARHLNLSTDYIHGLTQDPHPAAGMSEEESRLLTAFRALDPKQRALALQIVRFMQEQTQRS